MILFRKFHGIIIPLGAALAALSIGAIIIAILGANPFDGYWALLQGAFGDTDALAKIIHDDCVFNPHVGGITMS